MDDFRLKVFASAAKNLNFSKCAEQMHISQPAVSKHISELENHFGVSLFKRGNTGVSLTKAGKILLSFSEKLIEQYRIMEYEMGLQKGAVTGSLNIGASTTVAQYFLPPILAGFMERFDGVRISVKSGNSENIEKWLNAEHEEPEPPLLENGDDLEPGEWIMVRNDSGLEWQKRCFMCYRYGYFIAVSGGRSIGTMGGYEAWIQARLPMEGE